MAVPDKPAPPIVGKVTANSIELFWDQNSMEDQSGGRLRYCVQEEEDLSRKGFGNVYNGFAKNNVFRGLEQNKTYRYRLRISNDNGHSPWSQVIAVTTTRTPLSGNDLHSAVLHWELEKVEAILEETDEELVDSPDTFGMSPLMIASQKGYTGIVSHLIAHSADVNFSNTSGKNSLMLACSGGHMKIAVQLFEHGASLDSKDNGGSGCLHWAVDGNKPDCIQWLLDKGIQFQVAAVNGHFPLVQLLVENGADVHAVNKYGKTALDFAESFGRKDVVAYLQAVLEQEHSTTGDPGTTSPSKESESGHDG
ncbi:PREDICTED: fibronectin type 3 and ankyrin repeat domains protein 1-like [Acropora digitifera]|uniref:fibronectin type 3 and ankyrin repeat domains protein 1-like n=1 Tax=Acropora digitifera TaxID=70779 RepID=UPI00077AB607|nr:PREDICTED: fibronectin type 3 and ankyrin repeat domains protein 1-like [Acropora digitifera]